MPSENGQEKDIKNHQGLAAAAPRSQKVSNWFALGSGQLSIYIWSESILVVCATCMVLESN